MAWVGQENKNRGFSVGIFKKGGHSQKYSRYIRGRRGLRPAGGGAGVFSRGEGPAGGGVWIFSRGLRPAGGGAEKFLPGRGQNHKPGPYPRRGLPRTPEIPVFINKN